MSRTSNSVKMVIASTVCQIVILVCGFILPPMLISNYGSEVNGLLSLVKQLMSYFSIVCLGLGVSAQVALYKPLAVKDWNKINSILTAAKRFYNTSGIIFLVLIILSAGIVPFVTKSNIATQDIVLIILITGIGSICEYVVVGKYRVILSADQRQYIISRITAEGILLNTIVIIALIQFQSHIVIIQAGASLVYFLRLLATIRYVKRHYPLISFSAETPDYKSMANRWTAFSYQLSRMLMSLSPMLIVSFVGNLIDASVFSVYFMVISSLGMIAGVFSSGLQAPFGDIIAKDEVATLQTSFSSFEFIYSLILSISFTCGALLLPSFVGSYIHNTDGVNYVLPLFSIMICIYFFINNYRIPFTTLVEAKGLFRINNIYNLIEAISFIVLSIIGVKFLGLVGLAVSGIITALPRTVHYIIYTHRQFKGVIGVWKAILKSILTLIVAVVLCMTLSPSVYSNVFEWLWHSLIYVLVATLIITTLHILLDYKSFVLLIYRIRKKR